MQWPISCRPTGGGNDATNRTGTARIEGDLLCVEFPAAVLGRRDCGYVYRNPRGTPQEHNEYVRVALRAIYHFSVKP